MDGLEINDNGGARSGRDRRKLAIVTVTLSEEPVRSTETGLIAEMVQDIEANWL